ncbi:Uncharacterised protein [Mycobacteroides abscessus subsp. massiliense]|nr:Uncharacterised protein [Mycobacteroides abscessus subsp. abscessus]SKR15984.1 Uncharacterised protein [Mycobacteroides abscessus subsp. massiliense]SII49364.1 Uncharacterised protein [Mycobacteroides abscessus subsp. abscessus]SII60289.1 Uncharacterised protein [Mycobacteroides abscessus subsp. abscessus]SIJ51107.1 Uncharacterised protein [Mycobacteroides abscessus subsp. abscessus]
MTPQRITAQLVARRMEVAIIRKEIPAPALQMAKDLLFEIDGGRRVKGLEGRVRALIDTGLKAGALAVAAADRPRHLRSAVAEINAVASLAENLGLAHSPEKAADSLSDSGSLSAPNPAEY